MSIISDYAAALDALKRGCGVAYSGFIPVIHDAMDPPVADPAAERAEFLKRNGIAAPTDIGPADVENIDRAMRF